MFYRFRPVQHTDLPECARSTRAGFAYPTAEDRCDLLRLWQEILANGQMFGAVMEDISAPQGERIVWHCFKTFPTDVFAKALRSGDLPPVPSRHLTDLYRNGCPLPLLSLPEIRRANSDPESGPGLTMLVLNYGTPFSMSADGGPGWEAILGKLLPFTEYFSSGYRVREVLEEFYGDYAIRLATNAGLTPRTDYARYLAGKTAPAAEQTPMLMGLTAAEAKERSGSPFAALCQYAPPRFFFRPAEQETLLYALLGDTDEEIAARLAVAPVTVRKRWDATYARVSAVWPGFFHDTDEAARIATPAKEGARQGKVTGRGPEKKRYLLAYLRHHPEELRPLEAR